MSHSQKSIYTKKGPKYYEDLIDVESVSPIISNQVNTQSSLVQTHNWICNNHNISTCFTPGDNIYLNIISNSTYKNYDGFVRESGLSNGLTLELFHTLMTKSFGKTEPNYKLSWSFDNTSLELIFNILLEGFFPLTQTIRLDEKILSGDKLLTLKLTEMESKYQNEIMELKKQICELENKPIVFAYDPNNFGNYFQYSSDTTVLDFEKAIGFCWLGNYMDFNRLIMLKKIIIGNNQITYQRTVPDVFCPNRGRDCSPPDANGWQFFNNSLANLFDSPQIFIPSVQEIEIKYKDGSAIPTNNFRSLPNLNKISFIGYGNNQLESFELIKQVGKLKKLEYSSCLNISNLDQIKNWCDSKNIKLEIK